MTQPDTASYQHPIDWRDAPDDLSHDPLDISSEPLEVRAAYRYLSNLPYSQWGDWLVEDPNRRLLAARWLAEQYKGMDRIMKRENV